MLTSLYIDNFRSCDDVRVRLDEPVIALIGRNGVGKTNILHGVQVVVDLCIGRLDGQFAIARRDQKRPTTMEIEFYIGGHKYKYRTVRPSSGAGSEAEEWLHIDGTLIYSRKAESLWQASKDIPQQVVRMGATGSALQSLLQLAPPESDLARHLGEVHRHLSAVRYRPLIHSFVEHSNNVSALLEPAAYEKWKSDLAAGRAEKSVQLRLLHMFLEEKAKFGKLMELLGENGLGLISQIVVHRIVGGGIAANASPEASFAIAFVPGPEIAGTGRQFWFGGMSAGTWRVLELLTYLVFDDSSCMLLEQPEDSIHPGLLEKVVGILNRYASHTQVICTSHSPKVMNAIGPKGIRFVTAKSGTTIVRELSDNQMQAADTYLADSGMLSDFLELIRED